MKNAEVHAPSSIGSMPSRRMTRRYLDVRSTSERFCEPLAIEDYVVQTMPLVSPTKWHLAHTTWFFEAVVLAAADPQYRAYHPDYAFLFNSYYQGLGARHAQADRGLLSRPTVAEVYAYRRAIDDRMVDLLQRDGDGTAPWMGMVELGIQHEQQHQELLLTDIKHVFAANPLKPAYHPSAATPLAPNLTSWRWLPHPGGVATIGAEGAGFAFDNEMPRHRVWLEPFELADRLVTNREYWAFIADGGYRRPELWLSDGWNAVQAGGWNAPLYWEDRDGEWWTMTLGGMRPVAADEPVCHVSYVEADAFARWMGARLPREAEWETAAGAASYDGNFVERRRLHPQAAVPGDGLRQIFGDAWEWTASAYAPHPGFQPAPGAVAEYNGKFMCNQMVLRGGSCVTSRTHIRRSYRNFFRPEARWQFTGIRLARDLT